MKNKRKQLRLSELEQLLIERAAKERGITTHEFIMQSALSEALKQLKLKENK